MSDTGIALAIVALTILATIAFALFSVRRFRMSPHEFVVGSRSFGALLLWMLLAGEIYTSFTFLGAAGWAYGRGAPSFYILVYGPIAYTIGYFMLPAVWRIGKASGSMTWPDFLMARYGSNALAKFVALLQFALIVPYVTLQLTGLQILLTVAGYGRYDATVAVAMAFALMALFVFSAGLRGAAWASVIKDTLVLLAAVFAGIYLPIRFFGSPSNAMTHVLQVRPHWFTLAPGGAPYGVSWFVSTVLLTAAGFFMFPSAAPSIFAAKDEATVRRNMIFMPLYSIVIVLVLLAGFTALLVVPGLKGTRVNLSFLLVLQRYFPAWVVGAVCAVGCLAALVPASVLLLGAASVVSRNVLGNTRWVRPAVLVCAVLAFVLWFFAKTTLVALLLLVYSGITQIAPAVIFGLLWKRVDARAVAAGIVAGEAVAIATLHAAAGPYGVNFGAIALAVNLAVCTLMTWFLPSRRMSRAALAEDSAL